MARRKRFSAAALITVAALAAAVLSIPFYGFVETPAGNNPTGKHFPDLEITRVPPSVPSQEKKYEGFSLSFNQSNLTPNWVGWELLGAETEGATPRGNKFWQDNSIVNCPTTKDYTSSGYDRGHLCPAADQKWSKKAMDDCFVMANICPQSHNLNAGAWNALEKRTRAWARRDSALVIVAGPIYLPSDTERIGAARVRVPSAFFKVIIAPYLDSPRGIAFVFPNAAAPGNIRQYTTTIDEVEKLTGFDFFSSLPDNIENAIEAQRDFKSWTQE